jgi:D-beta-D-heptose 7-phosphate kinase/D-beta-D-heptose 1-phosphate adenosyltransferase
MPGGAGNVAANVAALGARAILVGAVGADAAGRRLAELCRERGIEAWLVEAADRPTTVKTRYIAGAQQLLRADEERTSPLAEAGAALAAFAAALPGCDYVVLSDYAKGVLCDAVLRPAIDMARAAGKPVIADPKRADLAVYAGVAVLKPNRAELAAATGMPCRTDAEVEAAALRAIELSGVEAVLATRSEQGLSYIARGAPAAHVRSARAREVFDVSGAGDSVIAAFAAALATGASPADAAELANLAGEIVVGKVGTAVLRRDDLSASLLDEKVRSAEAKVASRAAALEAARAWQARGLKVGFTNGCFDLLHPGHVSLLAQARAACDRLVVGLNSDSSVARLKGPGRPAQHETSRAVVLASLGSVDLVTIFAEDTPLELIRALRPDLLVKGADYTEEGVVGAAEVKSWGGRVLLARLAEGHSTTGTIRRMKGGR